MLRCATPGAIPAMILWVAATAGASAADDVKSLAGLDLLKLRDIPIVSAARHEQNRDDSPRSVSVITSNEIRRRNFRTVPEAVAELTGVFLQQTNYAGGSPIIRGMVGNRILLMVNGVRLNNGTYRLGPNQYLNSIDIRQVERIEVVRGSGSVQYGSDAFGGVINVITKSAPQQMGGEWNGSAAVRFASADGSGSGRLEFSGSARRLSFRAGYSREGYGDLLAGGGTGRQPFTGYEQRGGDLTLSVSLGADRTLTLGIMRLEQSNVPRTDMLHAGTDLEYLWDRQGRDMVFVQYEQTAVSKAINALEITFAYQRPMEYLRRIVASDPFIERRQNDDVVTGQFTLQFISTPASRQIWTYGLECNTDWITSGRLDVNSQTGAATAMKANYPDGSRFGNAGFFFQDEIEWSRRWTGVWGLRYDRFQSAADVMDPATGTVELRTQPSALTGSGYLLAKITKQVSAFTGFSEGFRAPNLDDVAILGGSGNRFEIPNTRLKPERSRNFEYGIRAQSQRANASVAFYESRYRSLIDRAPSLWKGLTFVDINGNGTKDNKELDVFQRQNVGRASVRGVEAESLIRLSDLWTWSSTLTWTHGQDLTAGTPLSRIPPLNGMSRLAFQATRSVWIEFDARAATAQRRLSPGDKTDIRIDRAGTPGFAIFDIRVGLTRSALAGLSLAFENLTDRRYRLHGSGLDRPGRGVILSYQRGF